MHRTKTLPGEVATDTGRVEKGRTRRANDVVADEAHGSRRPVTPLRRTHPPPRGERAARGLVATLQLPSVATATLPSKEREELLNLRTKRVALVQLASSEL